MAQLGNTVEAIARAKAGIFKVPERWKEQSSSEVDVLCSNVNPLVRLEAWP